MPKKGDIKVHILEASSLTVVDPHGPLHVQVYVGEIDATVIWCDEVKTMGDGRLFLYRDLKLVSIIECPEVVEDERKTPRETHHARKLEKLVADKMKQT